MAAIGDDLLLTRRRVSVSATPSDVRLARRGADRADDCRNPGRLFLIFVADRQRQTGDSCIALHGFWMCNTTHAHAGRSLAVGCGLSEARPRCESACMVYDFDEVGQMEWSNVWYVATISRGAPVVSTGPLIQVRDSKTSLEADRSGPSGKQ